MSDSSAFPRNGVALGIYERVNKRYSKSFYQNEFDQQWKTWRVLIETLGLVGATMVAHDKTMEKLNGKRDIYVDGPTAFGYLIDAIERKSIPLTPDEIMVPAMVHSVYRRVPTDGKTYEDALKEMIASGQIPKSLIDRLPKNEHD